VRSRVEDEVHNSLKFADSERPDLLESITTRVVNALPFEEGTPVKAGFFEIIKESVIQSRSLNLHVILLRGFLAEIDTSHVLCPIFELR
jgi:hypothetical protein